MSAVTLPTVASTLTGLVPMKVSDQESSIPPATHQRPDLSSVLVKGQKDKKRILDLYEDMYSSQDLAAPPVVSRKKGKTEVHNTVMTTLQRTTMRPELTKQYRVADLDIYHVISTVVREHHISLMTRDLSNLRLINKDFSIMIPKIMHWLRIDFSPLRLPRRDFELQTSIDQHRVTMAVQR